MGYGKALEAAGARLLSMEHFGSYQGDWIAYVEGDGGARLFVTGSYGSCSGCDAFQAEISAVDGHFHGEDYVYHGSPGFDAAGCDSCAEYDQKLVEFGAHYLRAAQTPEELVAKFERELAGDCWDREETQEQLDWVRAQIDTH